MKDNYAAVLEEARREFAEKNTLDMARLSGASLSLYPPLSWREFVVPYLGRVYRIPWPAGEVTQFATGRAAPTGVSLVLLHYLTKAGGKPPAGRWIPFSRLWGGGTYFPAFKKRALDSLAGYFGKREKLFGQLLRDNLFARPGKEPRTHLVMALPRLTLLVRLEPGDGEAPPRCTLLFDETANDYLVTEDLAALGENLAARLLRWGREREKPV